MRKRILLVIGLTLLVMLAIISAATRTILINGFNRVEKRHVEGDMQRVINAFQADLAAMDMIANDWAVGDKFSASVRDADQGYFSRKISDSAFIDLRLDIILILDTHGNTVFSASFDSGTRTLTGAADSLLRWISENRKFASLETAESHQQGIIQLPEGPLLAVSRPILDSRRAGPIRGSLVMARFFRENQVAELARRVGLSLSISSLPDAARIAASITRESPVLIQALGENTISAYTLLRDFNDAAALVLRIDSPRDIHAEAGFSLRYFTVWLLVIGVVFSAVALVVLERRVLSRLHRLSASLLAIGTGGGMSGRVALSGKDEIAYLGAAVNGLLDRVERSTEELRASERRNEAFLSAIPDVIFRINRDGSILDARSPENLSLVEAADALVGKGQEEILSLYPFISPAQLARTNDATAEALATGVPQTLDFQVDMDGIRRHYEERIVACGENEAIALVRDVTAQKKAEEAQRKEILLKEIHHRVKNNLQVISSLLALQASAAEDSRARMLLKESRDRVRSMALVHEKLYQAGAGAGVGFAEYARDLVTHLRHSYAGNSDAVEIGVDVEDLALDLDVSVPCGLIINELLSNALKHAFPAGRKGRITVSVKRGEAGALVLAVRDNGIGFPKDFDFSSPTSLGLRIVRILSDQLKGKLAFDATEGSTIILTFPLPQPR